MEMKTEISFNDKEYITNRKKEIKKEIGKLNTKITNEKVWIPAKGIEEVSNISGCDFNTLEVDALIEVLSKYKGKGYNFSINNHCISVLKEESEASYEKRIKDISNAFEEQISSYTKRKELLDVEYRYLCSKEKELFYGNPEYIEYLKLKGKFEIE